MHGWNTEKVLVNLDIPQDSGKIYLVLNLGQLDGQRTIHGDRELTRKAGLIGKAVDLFWERKRDIELILEALMCMRLLWKSMLRMTGRES